MLCNSCGVNPLGCVSRVGIDTDLVWDKRYLCKDQIATHMAEQERLLEEINAQQQLLVEKEEHANRLAQKLADLQAVAEAERERLGREASQLHAAVVTQRNELNEKRGRIAHLENREAVLNDRITRLEELIQQREAVLDRIYRSRGWKALTLYYRVRNAILPENTKRREIAKCCWRFFRTSCRVVRPDRSKPTSLGEARKDEIQSLPRANEPVLEPAMKEETNGAKGIVQVDDTAQRVELGATRQTVIKEETVTKQEAVTVSVVIPTKDAGEDFRRVLATIANQRGFRKVEIIVVDSGSTDKTVELADQFGAKVVKILPEQFSHSYARNLGARHASGQYLLFTVQDARPPSDSWLYELFSVIKNNDVIAVSCAEFPAANADLFYRAISWNHYRFLEVDNADRLMSKKEADDQISLRKNGQLSDLACLISRDVFARYEYKTDYGEDLDLGVRLIRDGYSLAFLGSTRIIHSHNRPAYYYLKRAYVDYLFVRNIFPDYPVRSRDFDQIVHDIHFAHQAIGVLVAQGVWGLPLPCKTVEFSQRARETYEDALTGRTPVRAGAVDDAFLDPAFANFLRRTIDENCYDRTCSNSAEGILGQGIMDFVRLLLEYMEHTYEFVDGDIAEDFRSSVSKAFAYQCGVHFAGCFLKYRATGHWRLEQIHEELSSGV